MTTCASAGAAPTADELVLGRARACLDPAFKPLVRRMIARGPEMDVEPPG